MDTHLANSSKMAFSHSSQLQLEGSCLIVSSPVHPSEVTYKSSKELQNEITVSTGDPPLTTDLLVIWSVAINYDGRARDLV